MEAGSNDHDHANVQIVLMGPQHTFTTGLAYRTPDAQRFLYHINAETEARLLKEKQLSLSMMVFLQNEHGIAVQSTIVSTKATPTIDW